MATPVEYAFADGVARITLVDGERGNPIHSASVAALQDAVNRARADRARVVLLGATGRFFSVGGDLASFGGSDDMAAYIDDLADSLHRVVSELMRLDAVVVSKVQGPAAGAGFPLAFAADVCVASSAASFTLAYTKIGLSPDGGSTLLAHTVGLHTALRLALLNDSLSAEEARAHGLVARVAGPDELDAVAETIVTQLASGPSEAFARTKRLLRGAVEPAPETAMRLEALAIRDSAGSADGREGVAAFVEKRRPAFGASA
ncbi:enoyl-CoA hydratase/isomerase family protein [Nocardioides sp. R-C-SC26]|uniref:enoyl-CoA hydratase/isomerase family protein n=1 Tax=Nocardioides sp. R-C-SC26 TaxID=2870414 RepID=UPI001E4C115F|nr:enoyl-CoA hydratase-related protein [Nocardioides sp. R-C-SC26]